MAYESPRRCAQCGGPIPTDLHRGNKVCSAECRRLRDCAQRNASRNRMKKNDVVRDCVHCGSRLPSDLPKYARLCSDECRSERQRDQHSTYRRSGRFKESKHDYYVRNRDRYNSWNREWRKTAAGKEYVYRRDARRRAMKLGVTCHPWRREDIVARDNSVCYLCGEHIDRDELHMDHVKPLSKGGDDAPWNIATTHSHCNITKGESYHDAAKLKAAELAHH